MKNSLLYEWLKYSMVYELSVEELMLLNCDVGEDP